MYLFKYILEKSDFDRILLFGKDVSKLFLGVQLPNSNLRYIILLYYYFSSSNCEMDTKQKVILIYFTILKYYSYIYFTIFACIKNFISYKRTNVVITNYKWFLW